jgi:K+-sensing histidine kinase KdpD
MDLEEIDALRRLAEKAHAQWRVCHSQRPRDQAAEEECTRLKAERDLAAKALFAARRPSLSMRRDLETIFKAGA